jgi:hypothetical protein
MTIAIAASIIVALLIFVLSPMLSALAFYIGAGVLAIVLAAVFAGLGLLLPPWWRA